MADDAQQPPITMNHLHWRHIRPGCTIAQNDDRHLRLDADTLEQSVDLLARTP